MPSSVGLEVMNSTNPELNWKTVTKGRRSRKSVARSLSSVVKVDDCTSPKRLGDFFGSEADKFHDMVLGQSTPGKSENVPLKKRRHLLQSSPPRPLAPSFHHEESASPRTHFSSPLSENKKKLQYPSCSSGQRSTCWRLRGIEESVEAGGDDGFDSAVLCKQSEIGYDEAGDFSGIELLAAAASMDDINNADKMCLPLEDSSMLKNSDASSLATLSKEGLKNESENTSINMIVHGGYVDRSQENNSATASKSLCGSPEDGVMLKVNRQHWDLNTLMDAWDEPYDYSVVGDASTVVNDYMRMEGGLEDCRDNVYPGGTRDESSNLKIENKSQSVSEDVISEPPRLEKPLHEPLKNENTARGTSDQTGAKNPDDRNLTQVLNCDADVENSNEVKSSDAVDCSFTKLCVFSGMLMPEGKINAPSGTFDLIQDEGSSSNVSECERSTAPDGNRKGSQDADAHDVTASELTIDVQLKDTENSRVTIERPGNFTQGGQSVLVDDLNKQNGGLLISGSKLELSEFGSEHKDDCHRNEGLKRTLMEDPCKSFGGGAQCDDPANCVGRIDLPIASRDDKDVSKNNHVRMVNGDDLAGFQEGYDSPYEDGELRGSFLYSSEDNNMENECVDYESDGRNGDGSDAADCPGSEIVECGSEGSHGIQRSLSLKTSGEGTSKSGPVKHSVRKHFVKDDSDHNEIAGKGSNAGSGTTVEQCIGMVMDKDGDMKRRQLIDQRDEVEAKLTDLDGYASKMTLRGKLQSRIEGRSYADVSNGKDALFMQQCRPRRLDGLYSRTERDISPDRYMGRYRSCIHGERDGVHQWASWGSRRRYTSNYQGAEGRLQTRPRVGESADKIDGVDFHNSRQTANYLLKGQHRPVMRRSPVEKDEYFDVDRRVLVRRVSNYRSRGHYSQRACRHFVEDFEHLPDDARMPPYLSRRERSFSPSAGRSGHMTLSRRRSRSRSGTRSPRAWPPRIKSSRRRSSRSPEFRTEARMERMRLPFPKPSFASDYGDGYGGRFSPQRSCRWVDGRNFEDDHVRRRRSPPVRVFRRTQRFDTGGSPARLKSDEYLRSAARPGRFSLMTNGGRECRFESNYDDRNRDDARNLRRIRHDAGADELETNKKMNGEDDPQALRKRVFNI